MQKNPWGNNSGFEQVKQAASSAAAVVVKDVKEGNVVKILSGYVKENNNRIEVHLNDKSKLIINPEGEVIKEVKQFSSKRKKINDVTGFSNNSTTPLFAMDPMIQREVTGIHTIMQGFELQEINSLSSNTSRFVVTISHDHLRRINDILPNIWQMIQSILNR